MTGQEKYDLLIQVTAQAGLTVYMLYFIVRNPTIFLYLTST
jgi:hypothetical protein